MLSDCFQVNIFMITGHFSPCSKKARLVEQRIQPFFFIFFADCFRVNIFLTTGHFFHLVESSVKASWFRTSGRYAVRRWLHALNNIASRRSTARGRGQVRRSLQTHTFLQASKFERKANRNEVFIATRDSRRLHYHFPLFYLQAASKTQAFDAGDTLWRPSSSWVDFETRSLLLFVANPRGLKLNYTHWHWASKSTWGWLHLFSHTARLVSHQEYIRTRVGNSWSFCYECCHGRIRSSSSLPTSVCTKKGKTFVLERWTQRWTLYSQLPL